MSPHSVSSDTKGAVTNHMETGNMTPSSNSNADAVEHSQPRFKAGEAAEVVHADGTIDYVDTHAMGGEVETMPAGYFRSPQFIGTVLVSVLAVKGLKIPSFMQYMKRDKTASSI